MNATRQDAWTKDEDVILAETVLRYIRDGKTQLEAFKDVAEQLSRTSAACGFRWNASVRKQYQEAIELAKEERKQGGRQNAAKTENPVKVDAHDPIETAIQLLEKMKKSSRGNSLLSPLNEIEEVKQLKNENEQLKARLNRYDAAWKEMGKLWEWVKR